MIVPQAISAERFEQILDKIPSASDKSVLKRRYRLISLKSMKDESERRDALSQYPVLEEHDIYELRPNLNDLVMQQLDEIFRSTGYTIDDLNKDHAENNVPPREANKDIFTIPLEYKLDGEGLIVSVDAKEIKYDTSYPLTQIRVLEFFGAGNAETSGYMLVPDGSGAIINMNNGKNDVRPYMGYLYGNDRAIRREEVFERSEQAYLPLFGIKQGDNALFGIVEEGSAFASIVADVSGRINSYNIACVEFMTLPNDTIDLTAMAGNNVVMAYQPRIYQGAFKIRYSFLSGQDADYVGMAKSYREYLLNKGQLKKAKNGSGLPFYIELIGAIDRIKPVAGVPVRGIEPLTTYDQAIEIIDKMINSGISNIKLKYTGWFNGGIRHSLSNNINLQSQLGGKKDFNKLTSFAADNGVEIYPNVSFEYAYKDKMFDGFSARSDAARFLDREVALVYDFDPATNRYDNTKEPYYIISPTRINPIVSSFLEDYKGLNVNGLSLATMGSDLNSNFRENGLVDREQAKALMVEQMEKLTQKGISLMASGVNDYALPYVAHILNMPMDSSGYNITDESVPFYEIALHGYISYAGEPINLAGDYTRSVLKAAETGAGLYFTWIYGENSLVKDSDYNYLYSVNYEAWLGRAVELYNRMNAVLSDVQDKAIVDHRKLRQDVYKVTFEGGKSIIVNYSDAPVSINDTIIEANNFKVFEGSSSR
ncbi:DUF5696 domain-containing protein [Mahella australiensis]|uniref:Uncharacterized protein n=1 Tax=Mahella australiensis (strain DSM 15567 / CIP 107919 / 50-1 BON) TaxID=697281 RepID=F3ZYT1_MAHA5|nr:DUF5696 domain-containing protein [Mahella australiensis]AEE95676.1 hypothetical protein Mahau_0462 [Mahella australiensis 50-1 BON]